MKVGKDRLTSSVKRVSMKQIREQEAELRRMRDEEILMQNGKVRVIIQRGRRVYAQETR